MKVKEAMKLHNEDEVVVKKTGKVMHVLETQIIPVSESQNGRARVNVLLSDGNWYRHTEIL